MYDALDYVLWILLGLLVIESIAGIVLAFT